MGLLDFFAQGTPEEEAAKTAMARGLLGSGSNLQRMAGGMGAYQDTIAKARAEAEARKMREQQLLMQQLQMAQAQEQMRRQAAADEKAKAEEARALALAAEREKFLSGGMGMRATPQQVMAGGGGPSIANAEQMNKPQPMDLATAIRLFGIDAAQKMAGAQDWGRPKVSRSTKELGPDGREYEYQLDEFGRKVGTGGAQYRAPVTVNQGNKTTFVDPFSLSPMREFQQFQSPDSVASNATTMRGQNMQDARSREGNAITMQNGKIPPGYRMKTDGTLEAIPGGPADIKAGEAGARAQQRKEAAAAQAESVLDTIKEARPLVGFMTAGLGGLSAALPATPARDLQAKLTTIKANLGFDRLQQMREQSPTGGALGQVAVQELVALQATVASLDQLQSPSDLKKALDKIERHYKRWQETLGGASGGATGDWGGAKTVTRTGTKNGRKVVQYSDGSVEYAD